MNENSSNQCQLCNTIGSITCKRSFLGFEKCRCSKCEQNFERPLSSGYRITYWVLGILFALVLLGKLPLLMNSLSVSLYHFTMTLIEQWVFILFVIGAFMALRKDARIKKDVTISRS